jgi:prevent-host-death family protein
VACLADVVTSDTVMTMKKSTERRVPAGEFKAKCLALFDEVEARRHTFVVTKRGRPVARVVPLASNKPNALRGSLVYEEDLLAPVAVKWKSRS